MFLGVRSGLTPPQREFWSLVSLLRFFAVKTGIMQLTTNGHKKTRMKSRTEIRGCIVTEGDRATLRRLMRCSF